MFCSKCGAQIADGVKFCPSCGAKIGGIDFNDVSNKVNNAFDGVEKEIGSAVRDVRDSFNGNDGYSNAQNSGAAPQGGKMRLKTDRGLASYIILSIITCGIYGYYFIYQMAHDVNIACEGDGKKTGGLVAYIVLSFLTCGIYSWFWLYNLGNRLAENAPKYNLNFQENGTTVLLWCIFGSLICGIGPFVAMNILIKNSNSICAAYNRKFGF